MTRLTKTERRAIQEAYRAVPMPQGCPDEGCSGRFVYLLTDYPPSLSYVCWDAVIADADSYELLSALIAVSLLAERREPMTVLLFSPGEPEDDDDKGGVTTRVSPWSPSCPGGNGAALPTETSTG